MKFRQEIYLIAVQPRNHNTTSTLPTHKHTHSYIYIHMCAQYLITWHQNEATLHVRFEMPLPVPVYGLPQKDNDYKINT